MSLEQGERIQTELNLPITEEERVALEAEISQMSAEERKAFAIEANRALVEGKQSTRKQKVYARMYDEIYGDDGTNFDFSKPHA